MKYFSTRGGSERLTFEETVMQGLAPNGGLYIPAAFPHLPEDWEKDWAHLSFEELALEIYSLFIGKEEIATADLKQLIHKSYATFRHPEIAPLHRTGEKEYVLELFHGPTFAFKDVALQFLGNLFEYFLERRNRNKKEGEEREKLTVVGATSGDTGSAAIYGLRSKKDISIFILHPKGRVSPIQEAQMTTVPDENVFNLAVEGTFDDCQDIVKQLFGDKAFNAQYRLGAINSINWARILAQIVYYFSSYFAVRKVLPYALQDPSTVLQYVVPTGNFGDVLAGYYAKRLGLPIQLAVATNSNDILARFWKTGRYEKVPSPETKEELPQSLLDRIAAETSERMLGGSPNPNYYEINGASGVAGTATPPNFPKAGAAEPVGGSTDGGQPTQVSTGVAALETLSPAMDILVSSNFERLLYYLALEGATAHAVAKDGEADGGRRARVEMAQQLVAEWMDNVKTTGKVVVPKPCLDAARRDMTAQRVSDEQTTATIKKYFEAPSYKKVGPYVVDPHTAVALTVANRLALTNAPSVAQIVLSTAHPAKFDAAVSDALSSSPSFNFARDVLPKEFEGLLEKERRVLDVKGIEGVREVIERETKKLGGVKPEAKGNLASV